MNPLRNIVNWIASLFRVWRREFYLVFTDMGVVLFFLALPTAYPVVYTLIYNPEIIENLPVAVVDNSRTAESRELARMINATQSMDVVGYPHNIADARRWMNEHRIYAVVEIPADYARKIGNGEQATIQYYADMSLLLRYRACLSSFTDIQLQLGQQLRVEKVDAAGMLGEMATGGGTGSPVEVESYLLGDPTSGFASFVMPGMLILIMQQSLILGVAMLAAGASERRRRNHGIDPLAVNAPAGATVLGKTLCYVVIYIPLVLYMLNVVPAMFSLPHVGNLWECLMFVFPMLLAASFLGIVISVFVTEREASLAVVVFTSVIFLFLSGLTWPRYAMNWFWHTIGNFVPATWGVEGFIRMNSNGSPLFEQSGPYRMLWILATVYFIIACILTAYRQHPMRRAYGLIQK